MTVNRSLGLVNATNARDLGGLPTSDGRVVRSGLVYRANALNRLTDADLEALGRLGLACLIDFRAPSEIEMIGPDRLPLTPPGRLVSLPLSDSENELFAAVTAMARAKPGEPPDTHHTIDASTAVAAMLDVYRWLVTAPPPRQAFGAALRLIASPDALPLMFHCTAGKDRTGWLTAVILSALGVDRAVIVEDYLRTNDLNADTNAYMLARIADRIADPSIVLPLWRRDPSTSRRRSPRSIGFTAGWTRTFATGSTWTPTSSPPSAPTSSTRSGGRHRGVRVWRSAQAAAAILADELTRFVVLFVDGERRRRAHDEHERRRVVGEHDAGAVADAGNPAVLVRDPRARRQARGEVLRSLLRQQRGQHCRARGRSGEHPLGRPVVGRAGTERDRAQQRGQVGRGHEVGDSPLGRRRVFDAPGHDAVRGADNAPHVGDGGYADPGEHKIRREVGRPHDHPLREPPQRRGRTEPIPDRVIVVIALLAGEHRPARRRGHELIADRDLGVKVQCARLRAAVQGRQYGRLHRAGGVMRRVGGAGVRGRRAQSPVPDGHGSGHGVEFRGEIRQVGHRGDVTRSPGRRRAWQAGAVPPIDTVATEESGDR